MEVVAVPGIEVVVESDQGDLADAHEVAGSHEQVVGVRLGAGGHEGGRSGNGIEARDDGPGQVAEIVGPARANFGLDAEFSFQGEQFRNPCAQGGLPGVETRGVGEEREIARAFFAKGFLAQVVVLKANHGPVGDPGDVAQARSGLDDETRFLAR